MKTHCVHGHELTFENTYVTPNGHRYCIICRKITNTKAAANTKQRLASHASKLKCKNDEIPIGSTFEKWTTVGAPFYNGDHFVVKCRCECSTEWPNVRCDYLLTGRSYHCRKCADADNRNGHSAQKQILAGYRYAAKKRNREWALTDEQWLALCLSDCHYCGRAPYNVKTSKYDSFTYNGIDRKDNSLGYTVANSLPCCKECNLRKGTMGYDEFMTWISVMLNNIPEYGLCSC